ncbi:endoglucanase [Sporosarcina sp. FSL K6-1508]|uniref:endoglucanase n=1 Tax=Sporosarcina sp. FSL K6-1508 TaxID=2921553 RepID=UPI0030F8DB26
MDGRYTFRRCIPVDQIDIANVQPGELLQREWGFRVNMPPEMQEQLDSGEFDPRNILHGVDGELYDEDGNFLAEVNTFHAQMSFNTADYQAAGEWVEWGITTGYSFTLTFTETVVRDLLLVKILDGFKKGARLPDLTFTAVLRSHQR